MKLFFDALPLLPFLQDGGTPLQFASKEGLTEVVRVLLASKADINTPDEVCKIFDIIDID